MMGLIRRRFGLAAAGLVSTGLVIAAAPSLWTGFETVEIRDAIAAVPGLRVGAIDIDPKTNGFILRDLHFATLGLRIEVGRVSAPGGTSDWGAIVAPAFAASDPIVLDDLSMTLGTSRIVIPHLEAKGSPLTPAEWRKLLDPNQPDTIEERLALLNASGISAHEITLSPVGETGSGRSPMVVLHDVAADDVVAGRIGALSIKEITADNAGKGVGSAFRTGAIAASQIDLPLAVRIGRGARSDPAMPIKPVVGALSIEAIGIHAPDIDMKIGSLRGGAFRGRPLLTTLAGMAALTDTPAAERSEDEQRRITATIADMVQSFAIDHVELRDLALRGDGKDGPISVDLAAFMVDKLQPGGVGLVAMDRLAIANAAATLSWDRLSVEGYDQTALIEALRQQDLSVDSEQLKRRFARVVPTFAAISLRTLRIDAKSNDLKGNAVHGTRAIVDVPAIEFKQLKTLDATIGSAHAQAVFDIAPDVVDPGLRQILAAGFQHFDISLDYALGWSPKSGKATLDRLSFAAAGLAALSFSGSFAHLAPELFDPSHNGDTAMEAARKVEVEEVRVDIGNADLAAKVWALAAKSAGVSVPLLKAEAKGQAQLAVLKALGNTPAANKVNTALSTFIDDPKTLRFSVKAPAGLTLQAIAESGGGRALVDLLDIDARANQ